MCSDDHNDVFQILMSHKGVNIFAVNNEIYRLLF
jgi:hypothetical protein